MLVNNVSFNNQAYCSTTKTKPAFTSVHPALYYVKGNDGIYHRISNPKTIKSLQRKLVSWLNKSYNNTVNLQHGKSPRAAKPSSYDEVVVNEFVHFFKENDPDYAKKPFVRSFYSQNPNEKLQSFILSGQSSELVEEAAKPIGQARGAIKSRKNELHQYFGIDEQNAKNYIPKASINHLAEVTKDYHQKAEKIIRNILSQNRPRDMKLEAYFVPYLKGKTLKYELIDAYLKREVKMKKV